VSGTVATPVAVGTSAPPKDFGPMTTRMFVRYSGASGDLNPMHYDDQAARSAGHPSVFSQGMHSAGLLAGYAVEWLGAENVRRFRVRFREQVWPGDVLTCTGEITAIEEVTQGRMVMVELTGTRQTGGTALTASAAFLLPA
jgi:acyl dehydratase